MSAAQQTASDPCASAFVSAHAGTGKTKLLVDRLLRLMLAGADPARILCLTYTKAAAAEMAIRLQHRLGAFVSMTDAALDAALAELPADATPENRRTARALFARVLDLPGGMRIGTIHAFCQSLLKRFPLEARISPHFRLVEAADAHTLLEEAREAALPRADPAALATLAGLVNAEGFARLVAELEKRRDTLAPALALPPAAAEAALRRVVGAPPGGDEAILAAAIAWPDEAPLRRAIERAAHHGSDGVKAKAGRLLDWLGLPPELRREHWGQWVGEFLLEEGKPRAAGAFVNPKLAQTHPDILPACLAEQARIDAMEDGRRAARLAAASTALLRLAAPILSGTESARGRRALLDYDDLIGRTRALLDDPAAGAAWVLFKLDGGLDHLLLDEVQDTAPAQWAIADRLIGDFFSGEGAGGEVTRAETGLARTVFAVGDRKQSIYSFQGADPAAFDRWRATWGARVRAAGLPWRDVVLDVSYRSTAPVLALVDAVFADAGPGVYEADEATRHVAHRHGQAGRVELWPPAPRPATPAHTPWTVPERNHPQSSAPQTLVAHLAQWIAGEVDGTRPLESQGRALRPGDVLVLVRRRGPFDRALVRALKAHGVPVAGLDRMVLTDQPAVQDLMALCDALLLPQDDLSFAEMLASPLGGLSDASLMDLAASRPGTLWEALSRRADERPDWRAARDLFAALLSRVDYAQPHALLSEALGPLGGRARLFARLGPEAADPVDELLAAALLHAAGHTPSLQGFLHWLRQSAAEIKREAEAAGDTVRIMTVHGAKGLEAPLVILPDTTGLPPDERGLGWAMDAGSGADLPLWQPSRALRCRAVEQHRAATEAARRREYHRLLYVALTRARDRLLVCGWELRHPQDGNWHHLVARGMAALGAEAREFGAWPGQALVLAAPQTEGAPSPRAAAQAPPAALPRWAGAAPLWRPDALPPEPALPRPLAPSRPDGVEYGAVPPARSPLAVLGEGDPKGGGKAGGFARGLAMHALLQHLPALPEDARAAAARAYAARAARGHDPAAMADQALAVLRTPELAPLFGPGSRAEQPVAGVVGGRIVAGQVDRLVVLPGRVIIADYKTGQAPPASADAVPVTYLRQMAAYRAVLAALYPDRAVDCLLIWTAGPVVMPLPAALLDRHAPGAAPS
jgi:ATP-dependent helicase/nuclease subunit A